MTNILDLDTSRPQLAPVWTALDSPIYRVIDEDGVNVAGGQVRRLTQSLWLYVDDTDGYSVIDDAATSRLIVVADCDHVPRGWDAAGNVVAL